MAELDFSRYGDTRFEVAFVGARLTTGGSVATEGKKLDINVSRSVRSERILKLVTSCCTHARAHLGLLLLLLLLPLPDSSAVVSAAANAVFGCSCCCCLGWPAHRSAVSRSSACGTTHKHRAAECACTAD